MIGEKPCCTAASLPLVVVVVVEAPVLLERWLLLEGERDGCRAVASGRSGSFSATAMEGHGGARIALPQIAWHRIARMDEGLQAGKNIKWSSFLSN